MWKIHCSYLQHIVCVGVKVLECFAFALSVLLRYSRVSLILNSIRHCLNINVANVPYTYNIHPMEIQWNGNKKICQVRKTKYNAHIQNAISVVSWRAFPFLFLLCSLLTTHSSMVIESFDFLFIYYNFAVIVHLCCDWSLRKWQTSTTIYLTINCWHFSL